MNQNYILDENNSIIKDNINIEAFLTLEDKDALEYYNKFIIAAPNKREWMDKQNMQYSYYCKPLVAANCLGWWILCNQDLEVEWNGGDKTDDLLIRDFTKGKYYDLASSHFGGGILTFNLGTLFRTPPGWGLLVGGPSNTFIDGLFPLEGIVETNWSPFTFTMNYKITRKNYPIKINKYYPICRIFPIPLNINEKSELNIKTFEENEELKEKFKDWSLKRKESLLQGKRVGRDSRMLHYQNGMDTKGCPYLGMHKLFYKYKNPKSNDNI